MTQTLRFNVDGISCAGCVARVEKAVAAAPGVTAARANLATKRVEAEIEGANDARAVVAALDAAGYPAGRETIRAGVEGLSCASCVARLEKALDAVPGVLEAHVNLADASARIEAVAPADWSSIAEAARAAGYPLIAEETPDHGAERQDAEAAGLRRATLLAVALVLPVFLVEMGGHLIPGVHHWVGQTIGQQTSRILQFLLVGAALAGPGRIFFAKGIPALVRRAPDMNSLVALGAGAAFLYSTVATFAPGVLPEGSANVYFEAAGVIVALILLGRWLEARAKGRTGAAVRRLIQLRPDTARVVTEAGDVDRPVAELAVGDLIRIRPGERVAADGTVVEGKSDVDEAMLTGEPVPAPKAKGDEVTGGTVNGTGGLVVRVTHREADSVLSGIVRMVEAAQGSKLPVQAMVDKVTMWFVPAVLVVAVVTLAVWLIAGAGLGLAVVAAVSVLIIACPCAMGLATPTSIIVGTGRAAELGVLFRKGDALQELSGVTTVVFDKTGTLTEGHPALSDVVTVDGHDRETVLRLAAGVEAGSEHVLARAIVAAAPEVPEATDFRSVTGAGAEADVEGRRVAIGNEAMMREAGADISALSDEADRLAGEGKTVFFLAVDGALAGALAVTDPIKPHARETVGALKAAGIETVLLTGDREATARAVADQLGIDRVIAEAKPDEKLTLVEDLRKSGTVGFVGDGINDAPALAAADVGIAIGTGTDIAVEAADVVLMSGDPAGVPRAITVSKATMRNIRQNLGWAFGYNVLLIPVAAGVLYPVFGLLLSPMLAAGAMAFSSVAVVTNALRLRKAAAS